MVVFVDRTLGVQKHGHGPAGILQCRILTTPHPVTHQDLPNATDDDPAATHGPISKYRDPRPTRHPRGPHPQPRPTPYAFYKAVHFYTLVRLDPISWVCSTVGTKIPADMFG